MGPEGELDGAALGRERSRSIDGTRAVNGDKETNPAHEQHTRQRRGPQTKTVAQKHEKIQRRVYDGVAGYGVVQDGSGDVGSVKWR